MRSNGGPVNIRIVTASAGTGKTTRLAELLEKAVGNTTARPEAILATTFTKQAAAELLNRARTRLLQVGRGKEAQALLAARVGTVNSVCGALVQDFAFELGLSPELRVLDEAGAALEFKRALASVIPDDISDRLQSYKSKFDHQFDWHYEVQRLIEAARANGMDADRLAASAERSVVSLDACLGPVSGVEAEIDTALGAAIDGALAAIAANTIDTTDVTRKYVDRLTKCWRHLKNGRMPWGDWATLCNAEPGAKSVAHATAVQAAASRHLGHPRLRRDLHDLIRLMFDVAAKGLRAYQEIKHEQGLLDFVDQEVWALDLLGRPAVRDVLKDELDLVLVDEFQDTSPLQLAIFLRLAELARQSVWVGDPKQAIFGFRGTDPSLMDRAIESLTSPTRDPDLVAAAVDTITAPDPKDILSTSYRSRQALIDLTNAVFTRAFASQGMSKSRVEVTANRRDTTDLGPAVSHWPLSAPVRMNAELRAGALAAGVRGFLKSEPTICDRHSQDVRKATAGDVAILCRTNDQCLKVSEALGQLGIASVVARVGLLDTAEAQTLMAGLRLWVDPYDRLAASTLIRIGGNASNAAAFFEQALNKDDDLSGDPLVRAVLAARGTAQDLDVLAAVDAVADAVNLRRLCAEWGNEIQRVANLDALRAHAATHCAERQSAGRAPTLVGLLSHLEELGPGGGWDDSRGDSMARVGTDDAVTVSTWHAAKGLEWPVVILFGLESVREPVAYGVHVLSDRPKFQVHDPLGGRWLHFWPNPYTTSNQGGPVKTAYAASDAHGNIARQGEREALRVLYVGWTRARDRLILAADSKALLKGLLGTLAKIDSKLITDPGVVKEGVVKASWGGHHFDLVVAPQQPATPQPAPPAPGQVRSGRAPRAYPAASILPSSAAPRPARLGKPERLGNPLRPRRTVDARVLGTAVHMFLASDDLRRSVADRTTIGAGLLARYQVTGALEPADLLQLGDRLWSWVKGRFGEESVVRTEWPLGVTMDVGTRVMGSSDLIVEGPTAIAVIDHKSYGLKTAEGKIEELAGQLGCYADALAKARPGKEVTRWVHLPLEGSIAEVQV